MAWKLFRKALRSKQLNTPKQQKQTNNMKTIKLTWKRVASVTRARRHFFTASCDETRYWVCQSFINNKWCVEDNHGAAWGKFNTAKGAMRAVETM